MATISQLTPKELKEIQDYLKEKSIDVQIRFSPQQVKHVDDGSLIIQAPHFTTTFVKVLKEGNGESKVKPE